MKKFPRWFGGSGPVQAAVEARPVQLSTERRTRRAEAGAGTER
jgi:hypothetical protein